MGEEYFLSTGALPLVFSLLHKKQFDSRLVQQMKISTQRPKMIEAIVEPSHSILLNVASHLVAEGQPLY